MMNSLLLCEQNSLGDAKKDCKIHYIAVIMFYLTYKISKIGRQVVIFHINDNRLRGVLISFKKAQSCLKVTRLMMLTLTTLHCETQNHILVMVAAIFGA